MEALVYTANLLYLLSYTVRDMLQLRLLTIVAACCLAFYFYSRPEPLMTVVWWNVFFVALNAAQLAWLLRDRVRTSRRHDPRSA